MTRRWEIDPAKIDGSRFAARYGLRSNASPPDFWMRRDDRGIYWLHVRDGIEMPDQPIFDEVGTRKAWILSLSGRLAVGGELSLSEQAEVVAILLAVEGVAR